MRERGASSQFAVSDSARSKRLLTGYGGYAASCNAYISDRTFIWEQLCLTMFFHLFIAACIVGAGFWLRRPKHGYPYPPSPPADPIIGHALRLPTENLAEKLYEWGKIYGIFVFSQCFEQSTFCSRWNPALMPISQLRFSLFSS